VFVGGHREAKCAEAELRLGAEAHPAAAFFAASTEIAAEGVAEQLAEQALRIEHGKPP